MVTDSFIAKTKRFKPGSPQRTFIVGSDDYSNRVLKWPSISTKWDEVKPKTISIPIINTDKELNAIRLDKTLMEQTTVLKFGFGPGSDSDLAGAVDDTVFDYTTQLGAAADVVFNAAFTKMFILATVTEIYSYTLSVAEDLSTATYDTVTASLTEVSVASGMVTGNAGQYLFVNSIAFEKIFRYEMSTPWDLSTISYSGSGFDLDTANDDSTAFGLAINDIGTKLFMIGGDQKILIQYTLGTAYDPSSATIDKTLDLFEVLGLDFFTHLSISEDGTAMYVQGTTTVGTDREDFIFELILPNAFDLSGAIYNGVFHSQVAVGGVSYIGGFKILNNKTKLYKVMQLVPDREVQSMDIPENTSGEDSIVFSGKMRTLNYSKELCTITVIDKFQQLSERKVGTPDVPVTFSSGTDLPTDIVWATVTSYGGYSNVQSTSNPDINWDSFNAWAAIFSGDSVFMEANFTGQKVTEILRKIARHTHSAIFINEDKLNFNRFGIVSAAVGSFDNSSIKDLTLKFDTNDVVNRQHASGGYDVTSNFHTFTVFTDDTTSINSFGLKEDLIKDNNVWYVNSSSALNFTQRRILANSEPDDRLEITTTMAGLFPTVGETIYVQDDFHSISESYRVLTKRYDMDKSLIKMSVDRTQISFPFVLDVTSLGSTTEVLT